MIIGEVVGSVWATRKEESLTGLKLLMVKTMDEQQRTIVAADQIGAGMGDKVLVSVGSSARKILSNPDNPIDASIVGIIDEMETVK